MPAQGIEPGAPRYIYGCCGDLQGILDEANLLLTTFERQVSSISTVFKNFSGQRERDICLSEDPLLTQGLDRTKQKHKLNKNKEPQNLDPTVRLASTNTRSACK